MEVPYQVNEKALAQIQIEEIRVHLLSIWIKTGYLTQYQARLFKMIFDTFVKERFDLTPDGVFHAAGQCSVSLFINADIWPTLPEEEQELKWYAENINRIIDWTGKTQRSLPVEEGVEVYQPATTSDDIFHALFQVMNTEKSDWEKGRPIKWRRIQPGVYRGWLAHVEISILRVGSKKWEATFDDDHVEDSPFPNAETEESFTRLAAFIDHKYNGVSEEWESLEAFRATCEEEKDRVKFLQETDKYFVARTGVFQVSVEKIAKELDGLFIRQIWVSGPRHEHIGAWLERVEGMDNFLLRHEHATNMSNKTGRINSDRWHNTLRPAIEKVVKALHPDKLPISTSG